MIPTLNPSFIIAQAVSPDRTGWAWADCSAGCYAAMSYVKGRPRYERTVKGTNTPCPTCHGTGKIPVAMAQSEYHLLLWEWAIRQPFYETSGFADSHISLVREMERDVIGPVLFAEAFRDIVSEAVAAKLGETT